jgi:hypothetical protein
LHLVSGGASARRVESTPLAIEHSLGAFDPSLSFENAHGVLTHRRSPLNWNNVATTAVADKKALLLEQQGV